MDEAMLERRLTETESRSKSNTHRLDEVERRQDNLDQLVTSVEVLATRMGTMETSVREIRTDVRSLTEKPARRWEGMVDKAIWAIVGAVIAFLTARIGL